MRPTSLLLVLLLLIAAPAAGQTVFFSEYIEGSGNNKALELYNVGPEAADLSTYQILVYFNGATEATLILEPEGAVEAGETFVLAHASADAAILAAADQTLGGGWYNGNDAIVLMYGDAVADAIGQVGHNPGGGWEAGDASTLNMTLRRAEAVCAGDTDPSDAFDPASGWTAFPQNTFDGLGWHEASCDGGSNTPPRFTAVPEDQEIPVDALFTFDYEATDDEGDAFTFSLVGAPAGAAIDAETGVLTWTPAETGTKAVTVRVSDGVLSTLATTTFTVIDPALGSAPYFTSAPVSQYVEGGSVFTFDVEAADADADALTFRLAEAPEGASIDAATGLLTFEVPDAPDVHLFDIEVTDGTNVATWRAVLGVYGTLFPGQTTEALRQSLRQAYAPDQTLGYDRARDTLYLHVERDSLRQVCAVYTGHCVELPDGVDPSTYIFQTDGGGLNAEHVWPQSYGASQEPARSDMYNLYPSRTHVNSARDNDPFAEIPDEETDTWFYLDRAQTTIPVDSIEYWSEDTDGAFEPREMRKGDIARSVLYFYTIYPQASESFWAQVREVLVPWDELDPPASEDLLRSALIRMWQGNVNPFVLDSTLTRRLLGEETTATEGDAPAYRVTLDVYPNPAAGAATVRYELAEAGVARVVVYDLLGREVAVLEDGPLSAGAHTASLAGLPAGMYLLRIETDEHALTRRVSVVR